MERIMLCRIDTFVNTSCVIVAIFKFVWPYLSN